MLVSGLREFVSGQGIVLHVTRLAKYKTAAQLVAVGAAIGAPLAPPHWYGAIVAAGLMWLAAFLTVATGWDYFRKVLHDDILS